MQATQEAPLPETGVSMASPSLMIQVYVGLPSGCSFVDVEDAVRIHVLGATVTRAVGMWQGSYEDSLVITILGQQGDLYDARRLAVYLKNLLMQDEVLVVTTPCEVEVV